MKTKRLMNYFGHVIWQSFTGHYLVAKGDGTDEVFETIEDAMNCIEQIENV